MNIPAKAIVYGLSQYYSHAEETEKIIINCALVAAGADAVVSTFPGLAVPATIVSCFGAVWAMYGTLCRKLGISLKSNVLKLLARAALSNILANLGGALVGLIAGMFFPGASVAASAVVSFITLYIAGYIFLQTILALAEKSKDPHSFSDISSGEMEKTVKNARVGKEDLKAARDVFDQQKGASAS